MIDKCNYELQMLQTSKTILHTDLHEKLVDVIKTANKGIGNPIKCSMCKQKIIMNSVAVFRYTFFFLIKHNIRYNVQSFILTRCGHGFHLDCLGSQTNCMLCITNNLKMI